MAFTKEEKKFVFKYFSEKNVLRRNLNRQRSVGAELDSLTLSIVGSLWLIHLGDAEVLTNSLQKKHF